MEQEMLYKLIAENPNQGIQTAIHLYSSTIKTVVQQVLPNQSQDIEECVADTFVALWRHSDELSQKKRPLKGWLILTARNKALDRYRANKRNRTLPISQDIIDYVDNMESAKNANENENCLRDLILNMKEPDKEIFLRKYYLLQQSKEIAKALGQTEDFVNTRLSRGRKRLRELYLSAKKTEWRVV